MMSHPNCTRVVCRSQTVKRQNLLAFVALCAFIIPLDPAWSADTVVVTATRTAHTADEVLAPVSVITREDIERSEALSLIHI